MLETYVWGDRIDIFLFFVCVHIDVSDRTIYMFDWMYEEWQSSVIYCKVTLFHCSLDFFNSLKVYSAPLLLIILFYKSTKSLKIFFKKSKK